MQQAYERMLPILQLAKCKKIRKKDIDERLLTIEHDPAYIQLKSYYEEQSPEYWANLELMGDCNDLVTIDNRKKALRDLWKGTYGEDQQTKDS